eukprot:m.52465 g.52465  ORF g.52465 m.52465 type:complete len:183 (+) comp34210_c1_seq1:140-688(+)
MGNGMNKIVPGLYIGNIQDSKSEDQLKKNDIKHIVSLHPGAAPRFEHINYKCLEVDDNPSQDLSSYFQECTDFIHKSRLSGGSVLVHCFAGVSRAVTITCAYLMSVTAFRWPEILEAVRCSRPQACPNSGFAKQLKKFAENVDLERDRVKNHFPDGQFEDDAYLRDLLQQKADKEKAEDNGK